MQQDSGRQAPPAFPKLPKSDLFSRLESFLPAMAQENKKLEEVVASGRGHELNIEVEEAEDDGESDSSEEEDEEENTDASAVSKPSKRKQIIEMNFALGVMDNDSSDEDSSDKEDDGDTSDKALKAALAASKEKKSAASGSDTHSSDAAAGGFQMRLARPSHKPRPVIQELN